MVLNDESRAGKRLLLGQGGTLAAVLSAQRVEGRRAVEQGEFGVSVEVRGDLRGCFCCWKNRFSGKTVFGRPFLEDHFWKTIFGRPFSTIAFFGKTI